MGTNEIIYHPLVFQVVAAIFWVLVIVLAICLIYYLISKIKKIHEEDRGPTQAEVRSIVIWVLLFIVFISVGWTTKTLLFAHRTSAENPAAIAEEKELRDLESLDYNEIKVERAEAEKKRKEDWAEKREGIRQEARKDSDDYLESLLPKEDVNSLTEEKNGGDTGK